MMKKFLLCLVVGSSLGGGSLQAIPQWEEYSAPIEEALEKGSHEPLFREIYSKETESEEQAYAFYTAIPAEFYAYQRFLAKLDERLNSVAEPAEYIYLRDLSDDALVNSRDELFERFPGLVNISDQMTLADTDQNRAISSQVISVSHSLQFYLSTDSATGVFLTGDGVFQKSRECRAAFLLADQIIARGGDPMAMTQLALQLVDRAPKPKDGTGMMVQILIDKDADFDTLGYPSRANGTCAGWRFETFQECVERFSERREAGEVDWSNPFEQSRLVFGALQPETCRMYRYWHVTAEQEAAYDAWLDQVLDHILSKD